jgi:hypothetical protein
MRTEITFDCQMADFYRRILIAEPPRQRIQSSALPFRANGSSGLRSRAPPLRAQLKAGDTENAVRLDYGVRGLM